MNQLDASNDNIQRAQRPLERAHNTGDLNERLRCLHHAGLFIKDAWNQITEWRKGDDKGDDRQDAGPTGNPGSTDEPDGTSVAPRSVTPDCDPGSSLDSRLRGNDVV